MGATDQLVASTATTTRGPPQEAEVQIPAEGMLEAEAMTASEAAATTGEDSLAEAGDGHGVAGAAPISRCPYQKNHLFESGFQAF
jgi:hypothetical protein